MKLFTEKIEKIALIVVMLDIILIPLMMWWSYYDFARKTPYDQEVMNRLEKIEENQEMTKQNQKAIEKIMEIQTVKTEVTGYCLRGTMASGKKVYDGAIACPRRIPLGNRVMVKDRIYVCEDRLAKRFDHRFDIWFSSCDDATNWGIQELLVIIKS